MGKHTLKDCTACKSGSTLSVRKSAQGGWAIVCNTCESTGPSAFPRSRAEAAWNEQQEAATSKEKEDDSLAGAHLRIAKPIIDAIGGYLRTCTSGGMPPVDAGRVQHHIKEAAALGYFTSAIDTVAKNARTLILSEFDWKVVNSKQASEDAQPTESGRYEIRLHDGGEFVEGHRVTAASTWTELVHLEVVKEDGRIFIEVRESLSGCVEWEHVEAYRRIPHETYSPMTDLDAAPAGQQPLDKLLDWS